MRISDVIDVVTGVEVGHCSNVDRAYCDRTGCSDGRSTRNVLHRPPIPKVATSFSFSKLLYLLSAGNLLNIYDRLASSEVSHESFEIYTVSQKKLGHIFTAYNFRNIEQIVAKFGTNHVLFVLNIMP